MGRAARAKVEARRLMKLDAWTNGVPSVVKISDSAYEQLRTVMATAHDVEAKIAALRLELTQRHKDAMIAAGLDPSRTYKIDNVTMTAELTE